jgi:hypothetical protein
MAVKQHADRVKTLKNNYEDQLHVKYNDKGIAD